MSAKNQLNKKILKVLLPLPLGSVYDYLPPPDGEIPPIGAFVRVPFGPRFMTGVVWGRADESALDPKKLKTVVSVYPFAPLVAENRDFIDWVADYTCFSQGAVLKMAMSSDDVFAGIGENYGFVAVQGSIPDGIRMTPARQKVLAVVNGEPKTATEIAESAGVSAGVVTGLAQSGALAKKLMKPVFFETPDIDRAGVTLSAEQETVARELSASIGGGFSVTVLNGVTGSGKTEVYFEPVARALKSGKQVLVLLPEIGLTGQWLDRFERRFGVKPALWHSGLGQRVRRETWKAVLDGSAKVVAGARSALFLPYRDLGLIVVDEEHDASYKQEDGVIYQARDMAVVRAKKGDFPVILSSATPSLETRVNVQSGKYKQAVLNNRFGSADLPAINLIDMRRFPPEKKAKEQRFLSPVLIKEMADNLERGEQTLLFLNRRGYAPLVLCRKCGYRFQCPNCSAWMVEHRATGRLECHHCGYCARTPDVCPVCGAADSLASCGPGVERIDEEVHQTFENVKTLVVTSDLRASPDTFAELMRQIRDRQADVVIGTQILAKGHHFPYLTLVGVVDADLGLSGGDLRAGERTYQMLDQVAGRAGREERAGRVFLQTYDPDNSVIKALSERNADDFLRTEAQARELMKMPPFGRLCAVVLSGAKEDVVLKTANELGRVAPSGDGVRVLGPAPAPLALLRGKYRYRLLLQTLRDVKIQFVLKEWLARVQIPSSVNVRTDIDPYSFL